MNTKERLIVTGIEEIQRRGIAGLSIRRVASLCEFSCATPYKHFKNKDEFVLEIFHYITSRWDDVQREVISNFVGNTKSLLIEISIAYIHFLLDNPNYRAIIFLSSNIINDEQAKERGQISAGSKVLIDKYCSEVGMAEDIRIKKTFVVRSLIYGAALMIVNGQLECSEKMFLMIRQSIEREFVID